MDATAPATKADIALLKADVTLVMNEVRKLYDATERWKNEIVDELDARIEHQFDKHFGRKMGEIKYYFDIAVENIRYDLVHANREEIEVLKDRSKNHERRIAVLERRRV
jgi:hypothetical protein